jgi:hypothetical protein
LKNTHPATFFGFWVSLVVSEYNSFHFETMQFSNEFIESCNRADEFPQNLISHKTYVDYSLTDYRERLKDHSSELFSLEEDGNLRFWEYDDETQSKQIYRSRHTDEIAHLKKASRTKNQQALAH